MVKDEVECAVTDEDTAARMQHEQWATAVEMRIARGRGEEFHTRLPTQEEAYLTLSYVECRGSVDSFSALLRSSIAIANS